MSSPKDRIGIFRKLLGVDDINRMNAGTICEHLGIEFTEVGPDYLRAKMRVDTRTRQPAGILHGGASVTLAESLGSVAAYLCMEPGSTAVGLDINANHLRPMHDGWVYGRCHPLHIGRTTHVWQIEIRDAADRLVCTSRLTMAVVPARRERA